MKRNTIALSLITSMALLLTSCDLATGIFKAGMWTTVIIIVVIVAVVLFIISKLSGGRKG